MQTTLDPDQIETIENWFVHYKDFAHNENNRRLWRSEVSADWYDTFNGISSTPLPIRVERGSICQHYINARGQRTGAGHWYSFFPSGNTMVLYDPSYPAGPYYDRDNLQSILHAARVTLRTNRVIMYNPERYPLQLHAKDSFCQTWSLVQLAEGDWQDRLHRVERNNSDDERLSLLYDFIEEWLKKAYPYNYRREPLFEVLQEIRPWFNHYYKEVDTVDGVNLWP